ncbi:uncharacterized protein FIBRA_00066 [Fibroporia radiculosa]|uniref:Conserved oligomeric Golgi complex subunit 8 n=1 Tax=Fibroporia radiculosa TaxID=599839 RepID=J7RG35_9APHY|nr:uncharacterized protein FIBRA_00066 [Fibroporia radiculosa]CCL98072.1 predicted protein [Fibroporia radiculosa]
MAQVPDLAGDTLDAEIPSLPDILASSSAVLSTTTLTSPDASSYLNHLTSLPLSELEAQPTELSSSSAQLTNALTTLCYTSYPTFLSIHSTTSTLSSSLSSLSSSLDALISSLPALDAASRSFAEDTREIQKERQKAALVLEHHDKLYDVLSLPTLLDSCIRNYNYNEALLLASHSNGLAQRFPANPLIQSVKAECDSRVQAMLGQLLRMLREQAKLPALFRAIGFLRKMDVLSEPELALAFLTGREVYLDGVLKTVEIDKRDVQGDKEREKEAYARFLKRYIDLWREGVYDVVTQYTSIFLDPVTSMSTSETAKLPLPQLHALLMTFTTMHLERLLTLLRDTLPHVTDPSLLTSLLTQLVYCANSFARVGMDFKGLLAPIFVRAVRTSVTAELDEAAEGWCAQLESDAAHGESRIKINPIAVSKRPSQLLIASSAPTSPPVPTATQLQSLASGPPNVPPPMLASYPTLASYTNAILTAFNGLRLLAPAELLDDLLRVLDTSLVRSLGVLLRYAQTKPWTNEMSHRESEDEAKDDEVVRAMGTVFVQLFLPFVRRALVEGVYGVKMDDSIILTGTGLQEAVDELTNWVVQREEDFASRKPHQ